MKIFSFCIISIFFITSIAIAEDFTISFGWGDDLQLCTSGNPNNVTNPEFVLSNVPEGTKFIQFVMTDLDAPNYQHGGGTIKYTGQNIIEPGVFSYQSPCPPSGQHRYEWTAKAKNKTSMFAKTLGKAKAMKLYPPK
jgi:phosphatidylethanolamine-binding protein (PEBP) family uncharacterized protein